jgi:predicted transcriptional regulator
MPRKRSPRPTEAELAILAVLWERGPSTVRQVHAVLGRIRRTGYTTTLKLLQIMAEKGLVLRDEKARAHVYEARQEAEKIQRQLAGDLVDRAFAGSVAAMVAQTLIAKKPAREELAQIRQAVERYEKGG